MLFVFMTKGYKIYPTFRVFQTLISFSVLLTSALKFMLSQVFSSDLRVSTADQSNITQETIHEKILMP